MNPLLADASPAKSALPPPAADPQIVRSERLGDVAIGVEGNGDGVRVTLGLDAPLVPLVSADGPRLAAELAAQGSRLQTLSFDSGGGGGGGDARRDAPQPAPPPTAPRATFVADDPRVPAPRAPSAARYA